MRPQNRFIVGRNTAGEDEVQLMLLLSWIVFLPEDFGNMQQGADLNSGTNLFKAFALQGLVQAFAGSLLAAREREVDPFDGMPLLLNQQFSALQNKCSGGGADQRPKRRRVRR